METISVFDRAMTAWTDMAPLRASRRRLKEFTYGNQWNWPVTDADGNVVTEGSLVTSLGKTPLTNNLLRSLVKSVVGRFRHLVAEEKHPSPDVAARNSLPELDARALEEFLISGCCIQRVVVEHRPGGKGVWVDNVSPSRFFTNSFNDPRGSDIEIIGMLHEMRMEEMVMRFGHGSRRRAARLRDLFASCSGVPSITLGRGEGGFLYPSDPLKCRVIEVWTLDYVPRGKSGGYRVEWRCRFFAPDGSLLDETVSPYADASHPFVVKFYPLTDGEVHPFIEDIVEQQRHINRLITMIDHVLSVSAKGVLLIPKDALPDGRTIDSVARNWNRPGGVIELRPGLTQWPVQLTSDGSTDNAARLLDIELNMMRQISGVSAALQGQASQGNISASMFESQIQNSAIALLDIFETFNDFRLTRNGKISRCE